MVELAAQQIHQTVYLPPSRNHTPKITRTIDSENSLISIFVDNLPQFGGYMIKGFVPGYARKVALAPLAGPFQGMKKSFRGIDPFAQSPAPQTSPDFMGTKRGITAIVRFHPDDLPVFHVYAQRTAASAIYIAGRPDNIFTLFRIGHKRFKNRSRDVFYRMKIRLKAGI
jgi:hypothetical protein